MSCHARMNDTAIMRTGQTAAFVADYMPKAKLGQDVSVLRRSPRIDNRKPFKKQQFRIRG